MNIKDAVKQGMKNKGIKNIKELSVLTGLSQNNLYMLTENSGDLPIKARTANKLNEVLGLNLVGIGRKPDDSIGYKLFKLRTDRDITAEQLSVLADISISTISGIERNVNKPHHTTIKKLEKAFKMNENELQKILFEN